MRRCVRSRLTILAGIAVVGCGERQGPVPAGPKLSAATGSATACSFSAMNPLVAHYFAQPEKGVVASLIDAMQAAGPFTETAQDNGFSVMALIAANIDAGSTNAADATALTNALLACMFNDPAALPATFPENFDVATDPGAHAHGAYAVRGGTVDPTTAPVYNRPYAAPFSVTAPPGASTWPSILSAGNTIPHRILVYGQPGSSPFSYDWKVIPRNTKFSPNVVVGLCADASVNPTAMLGQQNVGLLTFVDVGADLLDLSSCSQSLAQGGKSGTLLRASRVVGSLFRVRPAWAAAVVSPGGIGGSTGGIKGDEFSSLTLFGVSLTFTVQPPAIVRLCSTLPATPCGTGFSTTVQATSATPSGILTVGGVRLRLIATNNNGTPAQLFQCSGGACTPDPTATTDNTGAATFAGLFLNKTGGYRLAFVDRSVNGRQQITVGSATSARFNVKP